MQVLLKLFDCICSQVDGMNVALESRKDVGDELLEWSLVVGV